MKTPQKYPYDEQKTTVEVARRWVRSNASLGAECPCCGQLAKLYRRKLYSSMAYALVIIYGASKEDGKYHHVPSLLDGHGVVARGGDFAKLVHWELIESDPSVSGHYRVTSKGKDFVECRIAIPSAVFLYDGERIGYDDSEVLTIAEALGEEHYEELMSRYQRAFDSVEAG